MPVALELLISVEPLRLNLNVRGTPVKESNFVCKNEKIFLKHLLYLKNKVFGQIYRKQNFITGDLL